MEEKKLLTSDKMFTVTQAAEYLGLKPQTLSNHRAAGKGVKYVKYSGRAIRYKQADLDEYIRAHTIKPTK